MAATDAAVERDDKFISDVEHMDNIGDVDRAKVAIADAASKGQGLSGFEELSAWQTVKLFKLNTFICFLVAISAAADGYQIGMNGNVIANPGFVEEFATQTLKDGTPVLASSILSAWSSIMSVGQMIGHGSIPFVSNNFGRKVAMYWLWFILATSIICETVAETWPVWLVGKLLAGVGVGSLQITLPTYIAELAPIRIRGGLLMAYPFWFSVGVFFAPVALQVLSESNPYNFRIPILTQWGQIGLMIIIYIVLPESPAWLAAKGKEKSAKKQLLRINRGVPGYDVDRAYQLLAMTVEHEKALAQEMRREKFYNVFRGTDGLRTLISVLCLGSQQFTGLTLFSTFAAYFFQQAGVGDPFTITCITTSLGLATVIFLILTSDRWGRRWVACYGVTISWLTCLAIGILSVSPDTAASNYVLIVFACLWNVGNTMVGAAGWAYLGETSSQRLRVYTAGLGSACNTTIGVVMNVLTPYMVNKGQWDWGLKVGWFYVGVGAPCVIAVWLLIPETTGRSAAELDELFERKIQPWRFHKTETSTQVALREQQAAMQIQATT